MDWLKIVKRGHESKDLDYKARCAWDENDKRACCGLVKDILALANTKGGWLVIGVSEKDKGFQFEGVTAEQAASFDTTRVNRFVQNYADPPINAHAIKVDDCGNTFVVIEVPQFSDTPHVCQKEFPGVLTAPTIYVRTDNNESAPLKSSADFRALLESAVRKRSDQLLTSFRTILTEGITSPSPASEERFQDEIAAARQRWASLNPEPSPGPHLEVAFLPAEWAEERFDAATIKKMAFNGHVDFRGWPFLFISSTGASDWTYRIEKGLETCDAKPGNGAKRTSTFWQLRQSGLFFWKQPLRDIGESSRFATPTTEPDSKRKSLIFDGFSLTAGEIVHCLTRLYEGVLDETSAVELRAAITGLEGYAIVSLNLDRYFEEHICRMNVIPHKARHSLAEWKAGLVAHAADMCKAVFECFNWENPNVQASKQLIERMLARTL